MSARIRSAGLVAAVLFIVVASLLFASCGRLQTPPVKYHCPMHPTYISDRAGDCPICGMRLVPVETSAGQQEGAPAGPGVSGRTGGVAGRAPVEFPAEGLRLANVETAAVVRERLGRSIRTVGQIIPDETRRHHVHTKISGWVDRLFVNFTGQAVRQGEPMASIYSPELLATQEEFLRARDTAVRFEKSALPEVRRGGAELLEAARRRLALFDVPEAFIAELERTGSSQRAVTLLAPMSGVVTARNVVEGHQVDPNMELFTITDLSRVWVEAAVYENEARFVHVGQSARLTSPADPAVLLSAQVTFIEPVLDPATRTLKVRFNCANPQGRLKPGMFATVEFELAAADALTIADTAVIDTGTRQVVFVDGGAGRFDPREVAIGIRAGGRAQVLAGLAPGERVAVRGAFLLDSESRLRAAVGEAQPPTPASSAGEAP